MRIRDIYNDKVTKVFEVLNDDASNELDWTIHPTEFEHIPAEDALYVVKSYKVNGNSVKECFLAISIPERQPEFVISKSIFGKVTIKDYSALENSVIPAVASDCYGNYELYYSKENAKVGIDLLKSFLDKSSCANVIAEDLGYILRDEGRTGEAIEAFLISEKLGPSSEFIFLELSRLYGDIGQVDKKDVYEHKYKEHGGV